MNKFEQLRKAISVLAANADDQLNYLLSINHVSNMESFKEETNIDEIALQFEDADYTTMGVFRSGEISEDAVAAIGRLRSKLTDCSANGEASFWTVGALKRDARWFEIREIASEALDMLPW